MLRYMTYQTRKDKNISLVLPKMIQKSIFKSHPSSHPAKLMMHRASYIHAWFALLACRFLTVCHILIMLHKESCVLHTSRYKLQFWLL